MKGQSTTLKAVALPPKLLVVEFIESSIWPLYRFGVSWPDEIDLVMLWHTTQSTMLYSGRRNRYSQFSEAAVTAQVSLSERFYRT